MRRATLSLNDCSAEVIENLPDFIEISGDVLLPWDQDTTLKKIPGIKCYNISNGHWWTHRPYVDFNNSNIEIIGNGFSIGNDLRMENTTITSLPEGMKIGSNLYLTNSIHLNKIPKNLSVGGDLILKDCMFLMEFSDGVVVRNDLDVRNCSQLISLPKDLIVGGVIKYDTNTGFYGGENDPNTIPLNLKDKLELVQNMSRRRRK